VDREYGELNVGEGAAGGADFGGEDLEDLEGEGGIGLHEAGELVAAEVAKAGASMGGGSEGVRLVSDEAGKAQERAIGSLDGHNLAPSGRGHGKGDSSLVEDVETGGVIALMKENMVVVVSDTGGVAHQRLDELGVGDEGCRVESKNGRIQVHDWSPQNKDRKNR
jgi:hypothetical protein